MTWANHGTRWQIDHITPKNWFLREVQAGRMSEDQYGRRVHHLHESPADGDHGQSASSMEGRMNGRKLRLLARRRGCRIERTADGHFKVYAPDGTFLAKLKAGPDRDIGYFRFDLLKRLLALPVRVKPPAPVKPAVPVMIIPSAPVAAADAPPAPDVVPSPEPLAWQAWMTAESRRGTRAARRRQLAIRDRGQIA
jgi:hypothetical protein